MTPEEQLAEWGWHQEPSKVEPPDWRQYYQRWTDGSPMGWVEMPREMPIEAVAEVIGRAREHGRNTP